MSPTLQKNYMKTILEKQGTGFWWYSFDSSSEGLFPPLFPIWGPGCLFNRFLFRKTACKNEGFNTVHKRFYHPQRFFINLTPISKVNNFFRVWFVIHRNVLQEKHPPFLFLVFALCFHFLFPKQKWNTRHRIPWGWMCIKCVWSNGYVWCTRWTWKCWN